MNDLVILFLIGFSIAVMTVVVNSSTPIFVVLMQFFFPQLSLGAIIGSFKVNAFVTSSSAVFGFRKNIDWKFVLNMGPVYVIGAFIGASIVAELPIVWVLPILVVAYAFAETAHVLNRFISEKGFYTLEFLFGLYGGLFGASIKPMLLGLFRLKIPDDQKIMHLKMQIEAIVIFSAFGAALAHFMHGNLQLAILLPLVTGSLLGGAVGGKILTKIGQQSPRIQKNVMRLSFLIGIVASAWMIYK